jgi:hypothetical protein
MGYLTAFKRRGITGEHSMPQLSPGCGCYNDDMSTMHDSHGARGDRHGQLGEGRINGGERSHAYDHGWHEPSPGRVVHCGQT